MENEADKKIEKMRATIASLETRTKNLDERLARILGKFDEFAPRTQSIMREGVPLEIFSRLALMHAGYDVFGTYSFVYKNGESTEIERSVDIYAVRDSVYTVPEGKRKISGQSWPERQHMLVEVKQRKAGVEWVFSKKPMTHNPGSARAVQR
jgi:hypothetical protein